ncbi:MAG: hypothetical protein ACO1N6_08580 [Microcella sp.]
MSTITTRADRTAQHPPSPASIPARPRPTAHRVGLIDRIALRIGVALVVWSRRARVLDGRAHRARRVQQSMAVEQREQQWQRLALQLLPPR